MSALAVTRSSKNRLLTRVFQNIQVNYLPLTPKAPIGESHNYKRTHGIMYPQSYGMSALVHVKIWLDRERW